MKVKLKFGSHVVPISVSVPLLENIQALANEYAPNGFHQLEPDASDMEITPIFAGRLCYGAFGDKAGRKTAWDYFGNTIHEPMASGETPHMSIVEHSFVAVHLDGVSRSFSHEAITHRHQSKSQLSQRFVVPDEMCFIVPPKYRGDPAAIELFQDNMAHAAWTYQQLLKTEKPEMTFPEKKAIREAARAVLPNAIETRMVWSGNLTSWYQLLVKRRSPGAEAEFQEVANKLWELMRGYAPNIFREE